MVIVDGADQVVSATSAAERRITELGGVLWSRLPLHVAGSPKAEHRRLVDLVDEASGGLPSEEIDARVRSAGEIEPDGQASGSSALTRAVFPPVGDGGALRLDP